LSGGVAGAKYIQKQLQINLHNASAADNSKMSPQTKPSGMHTRDGREGVNHKIVRESMSLNHSALKGHGTSHGAKSLTNKQPPNANHANIIGGGGGQSRMN